MKLLKKSKKKQKLTEDFTPRLVYFFLFVINSVYL